MTSRIVHQTDGVAYLASARLPADHAIITSLPDHSELPALGVDGWRRWWHKIVCRERSRRRAAKARTSVHEISD